MCCCTVAQAPQLHAQGGQGGEGGGLACFSRVVQALTAGRQCMAPGGCLHTSRSVQVLRSALDIAGLLER